MFLFKVIRFGSGETLQRLGVTQVQFPAHAENPQLSITPALGCLMLSSGIFGHLHTQGNPQHAQIKIKYTLVWEKLLQDSQV